MVVPLSPTLSEASTHPPQSPPPVYVARPPPYTQARSSRQGGPNPYYVAVHQETQQASRAYQDHHEEYRYSQDNPWSASGRSERNDESILQQAGQFNTERTSRWGIRRQQQRNNDEGLKERWGDEYDPTYNKDLDDIDGYYVGRLNCTVVVLEHSEDGPIGCGIIIPLPAENVFGTWRATPDETLTDTNNADANSNSVKTCRMVRVSVDLAHRGHGHAKTIVRHLMESAKNQGWKNGPICIMSSTTFSIEGRGLKLDTAEQVQEFIDTIAGMDKLENVILSGNTFGVEACKALAAALAKKPLLKVATFSDIFTGRLRSEIPSCLVAFGDALKDKEHLVELNLSDNAFGADGVVPLVEFLTTNRNLQILKLNNNGLGVTGGKVLAKALMTAHERNEAEGKKSSLRVVIAGRNRLENGSSPDLAKAFAAHGTLTHLAMPQNGIRMEGIEALAEGLSKCPGLEIIDLQDNTFTERGCRAFASALPSWPELKQLNLGECLLKNKGTLLLSHALALGKNTKLEAIDFTFAEMKEDGVLELAKVISKHLSNLTKLELNGNWVEEDSAAIDAIREALESHDHGDALGDLDDMEEPDSDEEEESESESSASESEEEDKKGKKISVDELADLTARLNV
ncbi:hypothetical protein BGZ94_008902 [Podila epigama]|nr:hypothetical protein BGZ94_008902 [Podila epigama]